MISRACGNPDNCAAEIQMNFSNTFKNELPTSLSNKKDAFKTLTNEFGSLPQLVCQMRLQAMGPSLYELSCWWNV